jgi:hypothetical protein
MKQRDGSLASNFLLVFYKEKRKQRTVPNGKIRFHPHVRYNVNACGDGTFLIKIIQLAKYLRPLIRKVPGAQP